MLHDEVVVIYDKFIVLQCTHLLVNSHQAAQMPACHGKVQEVPTVCWDVDDLARVIDQIELGDLEDVDVLLVPDARKPKANGRVYAWSVSIVDAIELTHEDGSEHAGSEELGLSFVGQNFVAELVKGSQHVRLAAHRLMSICLIGNVVLRKELGD